jgi:hypothetical protein
MLAGPRSFSSIAGASRIIKRTNGTTLSFHVASPHDVSDVARQVGVMYLSSLSALLRRSNRYAVACDGGDDSNGLLYFAERARLS